MHSKIIHWAGWICTAIGVIDLPDQLQRWGKFILSVFGVAVSWDAELLGNTGRWLFTLSGAALLLYVYDFPQQLWTKILGSYSKSPLKIEFDPQCCNQWEDRPHRALPMQKVSTKVFHFIIHNSDTRNSIDNVRAEVERIDAVPRTHDDVVVNDNSYLGYRLRFSFNNEEVMKLSPDLRCSVDLASFGFGLMTRKSFRIEGSGNNREVFHKGREQKLHVKVTGDGVPSARATFIAWIDQDELYIKKE